MVPLSAPIIASIADPAGEKNLRSIGTVEKRIDANTYQIRTASGTISVAVLSGTLEVNGQVAIRRQGDQVIIQPLDQGPQPKVSDTVVLRTPGKTEPPELPAPVPLKILKQDQK